MPGSRDSYGTAHNYGPLERRPPFEESWTAGRARQTVEERLAGISRVLERQEGLITGGNNHVSNLTKGMNRMWSELRQHEAQLAALRARLDATEAALNTGAAALRSHSEASIDSPRTPSPSPRSQTPSSRATSPPHPRRQVRLFRRPVRLHHRRASRGTDRESQPRRS